MEEPAMISSVSILGVPFSITYHDALSDVDSGGQIPLRGQVDLQTSSIRVHKSNNLPAMFGIVVHECIHALARELELGFQNCEEDVTRVARGVTALLLDNKLVDLEAIFRKETGEYPDEVDL